jgi:hypothetical protein
LFVRGGPRCHAAPPAPAENRGAAGCCGGNSSGATLAASRAKVCSARARAPPSAMPVVDDQSRNVRDPEAAAPPFLARLRRIGAVRPRSSVRCCGHRGACIADGRSRRERGTAIRRGYEPGRHTEAESFEAPWTP